jgi:inner membrane protein
MEPLTHALAGAVVGGAVAGPQRVRRAALVGALAGIAPDLDFALTALAPSALPNLYHRTYTHALLAAPLWGLLAAIPFMRPLTARGRGRLVVAGTAAAVLHGLLDASTAYGAALAAPFSIRRLAWPILPMLDPALGTLLLAAAIAVFAWGRRRAARLGTGLLVAYALMLAIQHERATTHQITLAARRHHAMQTPSLVPVTGTPFVWRSAYATGDRLQVDTFVAPPFAEACWHHGPRLERFGETDLPPDEDVRRAFQGFSSFREGFAARAPERPARVGDARHSLEPTGFAPLWGIRIESNGEDGARPRWFQVSAGRRLRAVPRGWRLLLASCPRPAMAPKIEP